MIKIKNKGDILVYVLILVTIAVTIAYVVVLKSTQFITDIETQTYNSKLNKNIQTKADIAFKYDIFFNSDGSGFTNTRSCPQNITLSGTTSSGVLLDITSMSSYLSGDTLYCSGYSASGNLLISYSSDFLSYSGASYLGGDFVSLNSNGLVYISGSLVFTGTYFTGILNDINISDIYFSGALSYSDIDSNFNSDNYNSYSTGFISYPDGYIDNDSNARLTLYGYTEKTTGYQNVFWNNSSINTYIKNNLNNSGTYALIGSTGTGYLKFDLDDTFNMKILEFDSGAYNSSNELKKINEWNLSNSTGSIGYINLNGDDLTANIGSGMKFDFINKNYAIFLSSSGGTNTGLILRYKLTAENEFGSGIFINPLDDYSDDTIKYLGNDIIIDNKGNFISKQIEIYKGK